MVQVVRQQGSLGRDGDEPDVPGFPSDRRMDARRGDGRGMMVVLYINKRGE